MEKLKSFFERYKHGVPLLIYGIIYMTWFSFLESTVKRPPYVIHMKMDDVIPFCEYFIIPYLLWFGYVAAVVLYFFFRNKEEYFRTCAYLFTGMTIFLIISTIWPNGHHLRPMILARENMFTQLVSALWRTDTPTNLWPSIHVFNSIGAHLAVAKSKELGKNKPVRLLSGALAFSIILSTMFLKQHSVFDVLTAFFMAAVLYGAVYQFDIVSFVRAQTHKKANKKPQIS